MTDEEKSFILLEFSDKNAATFGVKMENVSPLQMLAVASWLEFEAKDHLAFEKAIQRQSQIQQQQMQKIAVPEPKIITGKK